MRLRAVRHVLWRLRKHTVNRPEQHWSAHLGGGGCPLCGSTMYYTIAGVVRRSDGYSDICRDPRCPISAHTPVLWTTRHTYEPRTGRR